MIWITIKSYALKIADWLFLYTVILISSLFYCEHTSIPYQPAYKKNLVVRVWHTSTGKLSQAVSHLDAWLNPGTLTAIELTRYRQQLSIAKKYVPRRPRRPVAVAMAAIAFAARNNKHDHEVIFDTDSGILGLDNRCSACISPLLEDFETAPGETTGAIKGFGGKRTGLAKVP
jgi:hypothetical protein